MRKMIVTEKKVDSIVSLFGLFSYFQRLHCLSRRVSLPFVTASVFAFMLCFCMPWNWAYWVIEVLCKCYGNGERELFYTCWISKLYTFAIVVIFIISHRAMHMKNVCRLTEAICGIILLFLSTIRWRFAVQSIFIFRQFCSILHSIDSK